MSVSNSLLSFNGLRANFTGVKISEEHNCGTIGVRKKFAVADLYVRSTMDILLQPRLQLQLARYAQRRIV
jgi:hypothetical protein